MSEVFAAVSPPLRTALVRRGFDKLTPVQDAVLAAEAVDRNLRISSATGSGKTVAVGFALAPALIEAARSGAPGPVARFITPTRELAAQVRGELAWLFEDVPGVRATVVTGGADIMRERRRLAERTLILVATPGRLLDHASNGALDLASVAHVVLDEADQMLDMGFRDELDAILDLLPSSRRSHLVSATFPDAVRRLADRFQPDALHLEGTRLGVANADIEHTAYLVRARERYAALVNILLLLRGERTLIFVKRRADAAEVAEMLAADGFPAMPFSGDLPQAQRTRTLNAFKNGVVGALVATDVAARGIDVADIAAVIHLDLPNDGETYTHRSGRTGRAGQKGRSLLLVPPPGERRVRRLLESANVEAEWSQVPTPKKVKKSLQKRARREMRRQVEASRPDELALAYAAELLESFDPKALVATLLELATPPLPCEPIDVEPVESAADVRRAQYVRYRIAWGSRDGANPSRLVAQLCRRGGIQGRSLGAIEIGHRDSRFEIESRVSQSFEARAFRSHPRDPEIRPD